jgi:hypothetical protein
MVISSVLIHTVSKNAFNKKANIKNWKYCLYREAMGTT